MPEQRHDEPVDKSVTIESDPESGLALDAALAAATGEEVETQPTDQPKADEAPPADQPKADDAPQTDQPKAEDAPPVDEPPTDQPKADDAQQPESRTPSAGAPAEEEDPIIKALNAVKLRADASQKTKDTFANLKQLSAEGLKAAKAELARERAERQKAIEDAAKAAREEVLKQAQVPDDVKNELEELRRLRARVDVESDPKFKEQFDTKREANYEEVYGVLAKYGLKESELKVLRGLGESEKIENITEMAAKLPPADKLKIEAKLFDNLNISDAREKALKDAREQAQKLHAEREQQTKAAQEQQTKAVQDAVTKFKGEALFKKREVPANTPAEEKKRIDAHNAFVDKLGKLFDDVVGDPAPAAKVEAAYGLVLAHQFKAQLDSANGQIAALKKELDGIKKRSGIADKGRLVNTPTEKSGARPAASSEDFDAGSSLDALAKEHGLA